MLSPVIDQDHNTVPERFPCRIVFVHGRKPKPPAALYRPALWRCLLEGVRRADPGAADELSAHPESFRLCRWSDLFYAGDRDFERDRAAIERLIEQPGPTAADRAEARSWRRRVKRLVYAVGDRFPRLVERFADPWMRDTLNDSRRYVENRDGLGAAVRERVAGALEDAGRDAEHLVVIGHSLGSVAVYEALWELTHVRQRPLAVDWLLTIGSPLGTHFIRRQLLGQDREGTGRFPHGIRHWLNFTTTGDMAALDPSIQDDFRPMRELGLVASLADFDGELYGAYRGPDGLNVHRSYGYLVQPAVGRVLADWWRASCGRVSKPGGG